MGYELHHSLSVWPQVCVLPTWHRLERPSIETMPLEDDLSDAFSIDDWRGGDPAHWRCHYPEVSSAISHSDLTQLGSSKEGGVVSLSLPAACPPTHPWYPRTGFSFRQLRIKFPEFNSSTGNSLTLKGITIFSIAGTQGPFIGRGEMEGHRRTDFPRKSGFSVLTSWWYCPCVNTLWKPLFLSTREALHSYLTVLAASVSISQVPEAVTL